MEGNFEIKEQDHATYKCREQIAPQPHRIMGAVSSIIKSCRFLFSCFFLSDILFITSDLQTLWN